MSDQLESQVESTVEPVSLDTIEDHYNRLKLLVESINEDAIKANKGNKSAGIRLRKSLRLVKEYSSTFVKFTLGKS